MNGKKASADTAKYNFVPSDEIKSESRSSVLGKSSFLVIHCTLVSRTHEDVATCVASPA